MSDGGSPNARLVRTVADQMADSLVDAAFKRLKEDQAADATKRAASWPAWIGLGLSVATTLVVGAMWFGVVKADIAYARGAADEAKAETKANSKDIADMKNAVTETRNNVLWLVKLEEQRGSNR